MLKSWMIILSMLLCYVSSGQSTPIDRQAFFLDDRLIEVTLTTDIRKLRNDKKATAFQPATIVMQFSDTNVVSAEIGVRLRGVYRKANCDMASLLLDFKNKSGSALSSLKELKFVSGCHVGTKDENLLLKEYLVYKIYNFISVMSFRVRLLHVTYKDSKQKVKSYSQYAFLIEDTKDLAKRNNCFEIKNKNFNSETTNRQHINLVSIFQYMIGNTDWSVPSRHNIKLIAPKNDSTAKPYAIPYDFDYAGVVNASYAVPADALGTKSVTERVYRGFGRNIPEVQLNLDIFKEKKGQILFYLENFTLLNAGDRKEMTRYIEDFYKIIENRKLWKPIFIDNARTE